MLRFPNGVKMLSARSSAHETTREIAMGHRKGLFCLILLFFGLTSVGFAEEYHLQYFLGKTSSKANELSKKEKVELLNQIDKVIGRAREIQIKLAQAIQTGEIDIQYQEGKFWMSKLEEDGGLIESGVQQLKVLREKPTQLAASIQLYRSLKDLSSHFNAYNNLSLFCAFVGDLAPEIELWTDPVFYKLYLLPLAHSKDEKEPPQREKKPIPKGRKP
jgi:hypothetical protein